MTILNKSKEPKTEQEERLHRKKLLRELRRFALWLLIVVLIASATSPGRRFWSELSRASGFHGKPSAPLNIHVLDVGKADAILIECEGHAALLDAGTYYHGSTVVDYLARMDVEALEYAFVSHPDQDHLGGMAQVLSEIPVNTFVRSRWFSEEYGAVEQTLRETATREQIALPGNVFELGEATLEILGPLQKYDGTNDTSLVIRLCYKDFTALFCGDIEKTAERDLVDSGVDLHADLLKVAHHGSNTSSTKKFLNAVEPEYAVVSVGPDRNELPVESVLKRLDRICIDVFRTDTDGNVIFSYGENGLEISTKN